MAAHAQLAFTAAFARKRPILARAVIGLPGLATDQEFGPFPTFTQANEFAQRLNEGLGLSPSETRAIVNEAILTAQALIGECESLLQMARELRERRPSHHRQVELGWVLTLLELGVTYCNTACTRRFVPKEPLLQHARQAISHAMTAMSRFEFSMGGAEQIKAGIAELQTALEECAAQA